jgi:hypothetical protein
VGRVNPDSWDVGKFKESGDYHDERCDCTSKGSCRPSHGCGILSLDLVHIGRVVGHVEIINGDMDNKNSVEVHEEVAN